MDENAAKALPISPLSPWATSGGQVDVRDAHKSVIGNKVTVGEINYEDAHEDVAGAGRTILALLANMLQQAILAQHEDVPAKVRDIYKEYIIHKSMPESGDFLELLKQEFGKFKKVFIVIDALDECPNDPFNARDEVLKIIRGFPPAVNALFFARTDLIDENEMKAGAKLHISARNDDLKRYILSRINSSSLFKSVVEMDQKASSSIVDTVIKNSDGINLEDIKQNLQVEAHLISTCAGIVIVDPESSVVRLVHHTAQQYFQDRIIEDEFLPQVPFNLAEKCIAYLSLPEFGKPLPAEEVSHRMETYPFLNYAADNWHIHLAKSPTRDLNHHTLRFLQSMENVSSAVQAMSGCLISLEKLVSGLHLATYLDSPSAVNILLSKSINLDAKTQYGETAMHWAIQYGCTDILYALIQRGADINETDKNGKTALHMAVAREKIHLVKILLESKSIHLNILDSKNWTPLRIAAHKGHEAIVQLLVDREANLDIRDQDQGWAAVRDAALQGHCQMVKFLIRRGAACEVHARNRHPWSVLCWAASQGHESIVRLLIEKETNLNVTTEDGKSALRCAMEYDHGKVVWQLTQAGPERININLQDQEGWSPLHAAVKRSLVKDASLLWLMLENGADVNTKTNKGLTALHLAATEDDIPVAWVLLTKHANINARNKGGMTALHLASRFGHSQFVRFLLHMGADATVVDKSNKTALHWAITELVEEYESQQHQAITKYLIEFAMDVTIQDDDGLSALHIIASEGSISSRDRALFANMLLERGCDPNAEDFLESQTPLQRAVRKMHHLLVALMMDRGGDAHKPDKEGRSAFHFAIETRDQELMDILEGRTHGNMLDTL
ncbi:hypothetical protein G7Z17_g2155 [Cylindrodendrum hubeiense]|uniref:Nephrocystin 3-like N-terminal domain-containing protein n=1 Tax=Cylindrodendrum hubeiense TaxID=595255 RepID=A0A9P5HER5_9HYPO|nr:hypothetical protein G7Z17_g2155 [Cylindrodendrum hubeiense]